MRVDADPVEHAFMNFRDRDPHAIPLVGRKFRVRKRGHAPRPVSVIAAQPVPRIVDAAVLVLGRSYPCERVRIGTRRRLQGEPAAACLGQHPGERYMGERVIRISAADIGMHAGEPDLGNSFRTGFPGAGGNRLQPLVPQQGMESSALVVERKGVTGLANPSIELPVRQFERPQIAADAPRHFVDGEAVGGHRVPETEEGDVIDRALVLVVFGGDEEVAQLAKHPFDLKPRLELFGPMRAVGHRDLSIEFLFGLVTHQPLFAYQSVHHADGEGAAAEPEAEDIVALPRAVPFLAIFGFRGGGLERQIVEMRTIVAAGELVDIQHVALQAEAERAAQDRKRFERRGADAIVVKRDLLRTRQVKRFKNAPDVCPPDLAGGIAGAVREQDDPLVGHRKPAQARS